MENESFGCRILCPSGYSTSSSTHQNELDVEVPLDTSNLQMEVDSKVKLCTSKRQKEVKSKTGPSMMTRSKAQKLRVVKHDNVQYHTYRGGHDKRRHQ